MISIVIPNYNGNKYLQDCIDALFASTHTNIEVIVVDNGSEDDSYSWIHSYENLRFEKLDKNYGFSYAVNKGIQLANGEYIILLNNDTLVEEGFVEELMRAISQDKTIFSVCSKMIQYHNKALIDDAGDEYTVLGWAYKCGDGAPITMYDHSRRVFSSCGGAAIYRKSTFEEIGYFDENFFAYMEDVDIGYRANLYGYKNIYCPKAIVYHVGSATSGGRYNSFKIKISSRNNVYVAYKNMPLLQLIINAPALVFGFLIKYWAFYRKGFGKEYKEGLLEGFKTLHQIKRVGFKIKHIGNYIYVEWLLIKNAIKYIFMKLKRL